EWVHVQLHQQKGMISLSPPTICNSAVVRSSRFSAGNLRPAQATAFSVPTISGAAGFNQGFG
ncbi:hypothetical protein, partial [Raoultella ornithinolytica]|uniref:hypothetical protein n=1 Tax=Raoultella ornithinolytica TaxID=54291 RepID=UPI0039B4A2E4